MIVFSHARIPLHHCPLHQMNKTKIALIVGQLLCVPSLHAATITVTDAGDDNSNCTLRQAIAEVNTSGADNTSCASAGVFGMDDQIRLNVATVTLTGDRLSIGKDVLIESDLANTTITRSNDEKMVVVTDGEVTLSKLTISGGVAESFGTGDSAGITVKSTSHLTIVDSVITNNNSFEFNSANAIELNGSS